MAQDDLENLLLPSLQNRLRQGLFALTAAFGFYCVFISVVSLMNGTDFGPRHWLNFGRVLLLLGCIGSLSTTRSRPFLIAVALTSIATTMLINAANGVLIGEVSTLLTMSVAVACIGACLIPWGTRIQAVVAGAGALTYVGAGSIIHGGLGSWLGAPGSMTGFIVLALTVYLAETAAQSRKALERRLAEARIADGQLIELQRSLEQRVKERTEELEFANRELEGFSYTVSHDLRSPLRAIDGYAHLLLEDSPAAADQQARGYLDKIIQSSRRMWDLIEDMLTLARVSRGELRREPIDLTNLARDIIEELRTGDPERKIECKVDDFPKVLGDAIYVRVAIDNLLRNAWKFTTDCEAAEIHVRQTADFPQVALTVCDNGAGFDMRFESKLFRPFERLHDPEQFPGTGIGLATVARIAQRHGGKVSASGEPGRGAEFTVTFDRA